MRRKRVYSLILAVVLACCACTAAYALPSDRPDTPAGDGPRFVQKVRALLPQDYAPLPYPVNYNFRGKVLSYNDPLVSVTLTIRHEDGGDARYPYVRTVTFAPETAPLTYDLGDHLPTQEGVSLCYQVETGKLLEGRHTYALTAVTKGRPRPQTLIEGSFTLERQPQLTVTPDRLGDYNRLYRFFGGKTERFLFSYRQGSSLWVGIDPEWKGRYITGCPLGNVHVDALPYFQQAQAYLDETYVRVRGVYDSGVLRLSSLIMENGGAYAPRYISGKRYISMHALGVCVDINYKMPPNANRLSNKELLYDEIRNHLTYTGIRTDDAGQPYYDFSYDGLYRGYYRYIPMSLINYLLYELAFYRAGFGWGFYFGESCDGMHFSLTESSPSLFEPSAPMGLRKVFEYIDSAPDA